MRAVLPPTLLRRAAGAALLALILTRGAGPASAQPNPGATARPAAAASGPALEARRIIDEAMKLYADGKLAEAVPLIERAIALRERALGKNHLDVASSLRDLATLRLQMGEPKRAEPLYERAIQIAEGAVGKDDLVVAELCVGLARVYAAENAPARALPLLERVLAIREKALPAQDPDVVGALDSLGSAHRAMGAHDRALPYFTRAHATREAVLGPDHPVVGPSARLLGQAHEAVGDYVAAEPLYRQYLAIVEKEHGPDHPVVAGACNDVAAFYVKKGEHRRAEALLKRAIAIREKTKGADPLDLASSLNNLAEVYLHLGDVTRAEPLYERSLAMFEKQLGPSHPDVALVINNLASLHVTRSDFARALPLLERARGIWEAKLGSDHPEVALALGNIAEVHLRRGDLTKAEPLLVRALAIREKVHGGDHASVAIAVHNLAALRQLQGKSDEAEALLLRAIAIQEKAYGPKHPEVATGLNNLASLYADRGDGARAEATYQRALAMQEESLGKDHPLVAVTLHNLGGLYQGRPDGFAKALAAYERANEITERHLGLIIATGAEDQKLAYMASLWPLTNETLSLHAQRGLADPRAGRLALTTILRRKGRVLDAMAAGVERLRRRLAPDDQVLLDDLAAARGQLAAAILRVGSADPASRRAELTRLEEQVRDLEAKISGKSAEFRVQSAPVTLEGVQAALPEGAALVEIAVYTPFSATAKPAERWGKPHYGAYVLRREGPPAFVDLGEAAVINGHASALRAALSDPRSLGVKDLGRALDERVMRPIRALLGDTRVVLFSPDGELNLIPANAMVDEGGRWLIERFSFTYLTSGRELLRRGVKAPTSAGGVTIVANPSFGAIDGGASSGTRDAEDRGGGAALKLRFTPLPGTAGEATALASVLPGAQVLTADRATKAALQKIRGPRILHVATHGFFLPERSAGAGADPSGTRGFQLETGSPNRMGAAIENPLLRSGLALAGANARTGAQAEGVLTALEASGLDLYGTKLVVLSACETAVGDVHDGNGVYGLRRALVMAGAETQVLSLWKVADEATRDLMVNYYAALQRGEGRSEGMRQVELAMLQDEKTSHPFYWASFIVSGESASLDGKPRPPDFAKVAPGVRGCGCGTVPGDPGIALAGLGIGLAIVWARRRTGTTRAV
jgi:MYXO-CTERM domain-containing protein